jgi:hypothetical protein
VFNGEEFVNFSGLLLENTNFNRYAWNVAYILVRHLFLIGSVKSENLEESYIVRSHALKIASKDFLDCYEGNLPTTCVCFPLPPQRHVRRAKAAATRRT